ncbi:MAG: hypothetical protein WAU07_02525, partial [Microgenomates group bacterium]
TSQSDSQSTTKTTQKSDYLKLISQLTPPGPSSYDLTQNDLITSYEKVWVKREPSLIAVQSVIIGGTFLMASAALLLHHPQKSKNNSLPALYVETLS